MILSFAGYGQRNDAFNSWDKNKDTVITRSEFSLTFDLSYLEKWKNKNIGDKLIDPKLIMEKVWDRNHDNKLSKKEWNKGPANYLDKTFEFSDVDQNDDQYISMREYQKVSERIRIFASWDVNNDQEVTDFEIMKGVFSLWDLNNSEKLEYDEFLLFDTYHQNI